MVSQIAINGFETSLSQIEKPVFKLSCSYVQDCPGHKIIFSLQSNLWGNLEQWWRTIALLKSIWLHSYTKKLLFQLWHQQRF